MQPRSARTNHVCVFAGSSSLICKRHAILRELSPKTKMALFPNVSKGPQTCDSEIIASRIWMPQPSGEATGSELLESQCDWWMWMKHNLVIYNILWYNNITHIYMVPSQNCVWNVPRCSGRMERRGFVTGLVPDLWSVMKYRLYINKYIHIYIYTLYVTYIIYISRICTLKLLLICTTSLLYTCSTQVCLAWLVLVH